MLKHKIKNLLLIILSILLVISTFNISIINTNAAELPNGQGYSGYYNYTYNGLCPGYYISTGVKNLVPGSDTNMLGHTHWCLRYGDENCPGFPQENASYKNISLFSVDSKTFYNFNWCYHLWDYCEASGEEWHCEHCGGWGCGQIDRIGEVYYRCQVCGRNDTISNPNDDIFKVDYCPKNYHGRGTHVFRTIEKGCYYCGKAFRNVNGAKCRHGGTHTVKGTWNNTVDYKFKNVDNSESATANKPSMICDYNSEATITIDVGTPVESYTWYKNGVEVESVVGNEVSMVSITDTVTGYDAYQLKFKVLAGGISKDILTSPIYLISGVQLNVSDTIVDSGFSSGVLDNWTYGTEHTKGNYSSTRNDLSIGDRVNTNDKNINNVGIFKITASEFGGNNEKIGPGISDTDYLYAWTENATNSTNTSSHEPYEGSGRVADINHYYPGYKYVRESEPIITTNVQWFTTLYRYYTPIRFSAEFINYKGTSYKGDTTNYNNKYKMSDVNFTYDRGQNLPDNKYIRKYYMTLKNSEPWLKDQITTNGSLNNASRWVEYTFMGWKQIESGGSLNDNKHKKWFGEFPYYEVNNDVKLEYETNPNRQDGSLYTNRQKVGNLTINNNEKVKLYTTWKSESIKLPNNVNGSNGYKFIDWSNKKYPDNRVYDKTITNNVDDINVEVKKNREYTPYKDTTLYAHWYKDVTLTFNLNGGKLKQNSSDIILKGTYYDYEPGYKFNIYKDLTVQSKGRYDSQIGMIDAYGIYDSNGKNKLYTRMDKDGTTYRFLGWSLDKDAKIPDSELDVFNQNRSLKFKIENNTTLYAVWEPILQANITVDRTLGAIEFKDGTLPYDNISGIDASDKLRHINIILRPGEQGFYHTILSGSNDIDFKVIFDTRMSDIYDFGDSTSTWKDELNPSTSEDLQPGQNHGLNRGISNEKDILRKFYMPLYIGTQVSYDSSNPLKTNIPVNRYVAVFLISQPSYYYNKVHGTDEIIEIDCDLFINNQNDSNISNKDIIVDPIISILDDLRTKIKVRIK